jgi:hypothetical protein
MTTSTPFHLIQALKWSRRALQASKSGNKEAALCFMRNSWGAMGVAMVGPRPRYLTPRGHLSRIGRVSDLVDQAGARALL